MHPLTDELADELCLATGGALAIRLQPTTGAEGARILAYLWDESTGPTGDCADVSTLIMSNSLLFDPEDAAAASTSTEGGAGAETETGNTETGP